MFNFMINFKNTFFISPIMARELAVAFVHPLFLLTSPREDPQRQYILDKETPKTAYGPYDEYVKNMLAAYDYAKHNNIPSIFILPFEELRGKLRPRPREHTIRFHPLEHSLIFEWSMGEPTRGNKINQMVLKDGEYIEMTRFQDPDRLGKAIASYNFKRIVVCGEMGPYGRHVEGCVGTIAKSLKQANVQVQGLENCIFPLIIQEQKFLKYWRSEGFMNDGNISDERIKQFARELRNATNNLYENSVKLETLARLAKAS